MNKNSVLLLIGLSFLLLNVVKVSGSESSEFKNGVSGIAAVEHEVDAEIVPKEIIPKEERDEGDFDYYDPEEILGIGKTLFIVVAVIIIVIIIGVPVVCCIICGCLCFRRNKKNNTTIVVPGYQPQQQQLPQHPQQGQLQIQTNNFTSPYPQQYVAPYNNSGYNYNPENNNQGDAAGQGKRYDDGYGPYNGNQKSSSPPRQTGPNRYDQMGQYPGDPNLIPNRFKPTIPAKPGRVPGWTAVVDSVKTRNKLQMDPQNNPYIPPAPISPDSHANLNKNQSYVRSTSNNSNPNPNQHQGQNQGQNQSQNPNTSHPHPHTHPQGYNNEAYDGGVSSLPQSPVPYPYSQNTSQGYNPHPTTNPNPNPNPTNYGSPLPQGGYNGHNDNFMY